MMTKRVISFALVLCLMLTFIPLNVFAQESDTEQQTSALDERNEAQTQSEGEQKEAVLVPSEGFESGDGTETAPYVIRDASQLMYLATTALEGNTYEGKVISFAADIDMSDYSWAPIPTFKGKILGNNFTISNLFIENNTSISADSSNYYHIGFIGCNSGTISYLNFSNVNVTVAYGAARVGAIAGDNNGTIAHCKVSGSVTDNTTLTGDIMVGGIAGFSGSGSSITACTMNGTILGKSSSAISKVGGIAGESGGNIVACSTSGSVEANVTTSSYSYAGGVAGYVYAGQISNSFSTGVITSNCSGTSAMAGGIVGELSAATISKCYFAGSSVTATSSGSDKYAYSGGIVGYGKTSGQISSCFALGSMSASTKTDSTTTGYASAIIALNESSAVTISNCYHSSAMTFYWTKSYQYSYKDGCDTKYAWANESYTTASNSLSTASADTQFKAVSFVKDTLGWGAFSEISNAESDYNNVWVLNGSFPVHYTSVVYDVVVVEILKDVVMKVTHSTYPNGYAFNYDAESFLGYTADLSYVGGEVTEDKVYTITYVPNQHYVFITCVSSKDGKEIFDNQFVYEYGEEYNNQKDADLVPTIPGYTVQTNSAIVSGVMGNESVELTLVYDPNLYTLTINYKYENGETAAPTVSLNEYYDYSYSISSPAIDGYTPKDAEDNILTVVEGTLKEDTVYDIIYEAVECTINVRYLYEDGSEAAPSKTIGKKFGDAYDVAALDITGYTPNISGYSGTVTQTELNLNFVYSINYYTLIINYVDANDIEKAPSYTAVLPYGAEYTVNSPVLEGYYISQSVVEGTIDAEMVKNAVEGVITETVRYNLNPHMLVINYYVGDTVIAKYEEQYDYTANYSVNSLQQVPSVYAEYYNLIDPSQEIIAGIMPDEDQTIDVYFERTAIGSGYCGEGVKWKLYKDGELVIYAGNDGVMYDYNADNIPWRDNLEKITTISVEGNLAYVGAYAFSGCVNITDVSFLNNVKRIGKFAFSGCDSILEISVPQSVEIIDDGAFAEMANLVYISVDANNANYASVNGVLYSKDCTDLVAYPSGLHNADIVIEDAVDKICGYAFYGIEYIKTVTFGANVTYIGDFAFAGTKLSSVQIDTALGYLGENAFACSSLKTVYFRNNVPGTVGANAFGENREKVFVYYPLDNSTWKSQITTEIVDEYKYYYWQNYKAYGISNVNDITLEYLWTMDIYAFRVLYEKDATPIANVTVTFGNQTATTDKDGFVYFVVDDELVWSYLTLSRTGYSSNYNVANRYVLKEIGIDYLTMSDESTVQGTRCNGDNIANGEAYINTMFDGESKIILQGNSAFEIIEMSIVQNGVILGSTKDIWNDGRCILEIKNGSFQMGAGDIYAYMRIKDGDQERTAAVSKLNIILISVNMSQAQLLESLTSALGDTFSGLTIPLKDTGISILDGSKIKLMPPKFLQEAPGYDALSAISVSCDNNQVFVSINLNDYYDQCVENLNATTREEYKDYVISVIGRETFDEYCNLSGLSEEEALEKVGVDLDEHNLLKLEDFNTSVEEKGKAFMSGMANKIDEFWQNKKLVNKVDTKGSFQFNVDLAGGFVISFDETGSDVTATLQVTIQLKSGISTEIVVVFVPVVIEVNVTAEGAITFGQIDIDLENKRIELPEYVRVDAKGTLKIYAGIGTRIISIGLFGQLSLETAIQIGGGDVYFDGLYWEGSLGAYAKLKIGFISWEQNWVWASGGGYLIKPRSLLSSPGVAMTAYDLSTYTLASVVGSIENVKWSADSTMDVVDDSYAYSNTQIAYVGEQLIMVYIDTVDEYNAYNASTLMYSVYDFETNTWSEGVSVDNNQKRDTDFSIIVNGNEMYIVYAEANRSFADGEFDNADNSESIITTSLAQEISVVKFNASTGEFTDYQTLTNDNYHDSTPIIGLVDGKITVAWTKNTGDEESAVFGANYNNEIYVASLNGSQWSTPSCVQYGCGMIVDMAIGETSTASVSFIVDLDSDMYTDGDRALYVYDLSNGDMKFFEGYDTYVSNLQYVTYNGQKMLTWFEDYNIAYTLDGVNVEYLFDEPIDNLDSEYKFIEVTEGVYAIVWTVPTEEKSVVYARFCDLDGTWGDVKELFETSYYQMYMDVVSVHGDLKFAISSTQMQMVDTELTMYSKIGFMSLTTGYGMDISDVEVEGNASENIMSLSATLTNTSVKEIQNVGIYIKEYRPSTGKYVYYVGGVYAVNLTAGETQSFTFTCDYIKDFDYANTSLVIEVFEGTLEDLQKKVNSLNQDKVVIAGTSTMGSITVLPNYNAGISGTGTAETEFDYRYDLQVEGEYIIIGSTEYLSIKVTNVGYLTANGLLQVKQQDTCNIIYEAYIDDLESGCTKYYLIKLDKEYFEATNATFVCTLSFDDDENQENNVCNILAYKIEGADIVPYDELATAVDMSTHNATFDKYTPSDVEVDIALNGNEFIGISNVENGKYEATNIDEGVIRVSIDGDYLATLENGEYPLEFLFETERSWINSYLNLLVVDNTPIPVDGFISIEGVLARGNKLSVDISKLDQLYDITYAWYIDDVLVSTEPTYTATEEDRLGYLRVEVAATGLLEGQFAEEYYITEVGEFTVDISDIVASLGYKWYVGGELVSEDLTYTITNNDVGKPIYVEVIGNGSYEGTITSITYNIPKVVRTVGTPVLESADGDNVILGNLFLFGDGNLYFGYSTTNDPTTVTNWQQDKNFTLSDDGYYYFFAQATEGDVYALAYSDSVGYAYNVSKIIWVVDTTVTEELYDDGEVPEYKHSVIKQNDANNHYDFAGWDCNGDGVVDYAQNDELPSVKSETSTYTAVYTITPIIVSTELNVRGSTLSIQSDISINYYISASALSQYESFYVEFTKDYYNSDGTISQIVTIVEDYAISGSYYVFSYNGIAAKEMKDDIRATVYAFKEGAIYCSEIDIYNVATYAYNRVSNSSNEYMVNLAICLLNYGAAAQEYFGYNVENLANAQLSDAQKAISTKDIEYTSVKEYITPDNAMVLFTGSSLSLEDKVAINYYFNADQYLAAGNDLSELSLVIKYGDNTEVVSADKFILSSSNGYYVNFDKLAAKDMKTVCEATFWMNYGTEEQCIVGETMIYSIESYAQNKQNSSDAKLVAMMKAMMHYGEAAYVYAANN